MVSICVPTFNGAEVVCGALDSALEQDYPNVEVIVVDDASTDRTPALLRSRYAGQIRLYARSRRAGHNRNWNTTVRLARGAFVKFLHQDDRLLPSAVSTMAQLFTEHASLAMVFTRRRVELDSAQKAA